MRESTAPVTLSRIGLLS